jgi:hypothetical protein
MTLKTRDGTIELPEDLGKLAETIGALLKQCPEVLPLLLARLFIGLREMENKQTGKENLK